eukprot:COSAG02_NODE_152_length_33208_cov_13.316591_32_plen_64_part_00
MEENGKTSGGHIPPQLWRVALYCLSTPLQSQPHSTGAFTYEVITPRRRLDTESSLALRSAVVL